MPSQYTPKDIDRFWSKVDKSPHPRGCWLWRGSRNSDGYGDIKIKRHMVKAHRMAWEVTNGRPLGDLRACHHCDNPACCNPEHIFAGTQIENIADMDAKGRRGMPYPRMKLTPDAVREIRRQHEAGTATYADLGKAFGVSTRTVYGVVKRYRWKHI